jgi:hypothetical protein
VRIAEAAAATAINILPVVVIATAGAYARKGLQLI